MYRNYYFQLSLQVNYLASAYMQANIELLLFLMCQLRF